MTPSLKPNNTTGQQKTVRSLIPAIAQGLLILVTVVAYWQVVHHDFVDYDDPAYVTANPHVREGVTLSGLEWAFTRMAGEDTYWHPMTWISHMLDCQLFGINPGAHHLVNVFFHAANVYLLFLILRKLTDSVGRTAFACALFALHPLQVDTVAWIAERKNLLSTLFCLLAIITYIQYVRRQGQPLKSRTPAYLLTMLFFALGLMAKPAVVTLPCALLLFDFWPLRRWQAAPLTGTTVHWSYLILEKAPLFALSLISSIITLRAHERLGLIASGDELPLSHRLANAIVSYVLYLGKVVWPGDLAVYYPYPATLPVAMVAGAAALLGAVTAVVILAARSRPYILVGWLWFLGMLVPAIGLVQASNQAMADRFVYAPLIGLAIIAAWGGFDILKALRVPRGVTMFLAVSTVALCGLLTWRQTHYWQNSLTLFERDVKVTRNNYLAHVNYGTALAQRGYNTAAKTNFLAALEIKPDSAEALNGLGVIYFEERNSAKAVSNFLAAVRIKPAYAEAHNNLGNALALQANMVAAADHYAAALSIKTNYAEPHNNLGRIMEMQGRLPEALAEYRAALEINPSYAEAHLNFAKTLLNQGETSEAANHLQAALRLNPNLKEAHYVLARVLLKQGEGMDASRQFALALGKQPSDPETISAMALSLVNQNQVAQAIDYLKRAVAEHPANPDLHDNLGNAYAIAGQPNQAVGEYMAALRVRPDFPEAHFNLGNVLNSQEKAKEAIAEYQEALRLKPDYFDAHLNLAGILLLQDKFADACPHFAAAIALNPNDARAHFELGLASEGLGRVEIAAREYAAALRLKPDYQEAKTHLANLPTGHPK